MVRSRARVAERASATVLVAGAVAAVVLVLAGALTVVSAVLGAHRARAAADLAALAAAVPLASGGVADCGAAAQVAVANGAALTGCAADGAGVTVRVAVALPVGGGAAWWGLPASTEARARAGPDAGGAPAGPS